MVLELAVARAGPRPRHPPFETVLVRAKEVDHGCSSPLGRIPPRNPTTGLRALHRAAAWRAAVRGAGEVVWGGGALVGTGQRDPPCPQPPDGTLRGEHRVPCLSGVRRPLQ